MEAAMGEHYSHLSLAERRRIDEMFQAVDQARRHHDGSVIYGLIRNIFNAVARSIFYVVC
ncbi:hypothetical protein C0V82_26205 (plasmid) [Niveispirillum cyanobacteriorum]|uniref:Uncharacterized protein n=1 Tax=Niveispirillum cyanobacteriorum TaxID=1612173 RepID=A0A2K9NMS4_9PROT|nr:hypothetical protein C0V82_26205 [Niveispirillum cyanobacteriorum]GGE85911.1 hypothetical protein GCM10011317_48850 [Niveispirillum cyanobacteriorum]